jgi:hypothetical protein
MPLRRSLAARIISQRKVTEARAKRVTERGFCDGATPRKPLVSAS